FNKQTRLYPRAIHREREPSPVATATSHGSRTVLVVARRAETFAHRALEPRIHNDSGASFVMASTSRRLSLIWAAARFSLRCWTLVVPGIGSAWAVRCSCQARATCCGVAS